MSAPETEESLVKDFEQRGYQHVHVRRDQPNFRYHRHYHPRHVELHVLEGELEVQEDTKTTIVKPGEHAVIDAERFHATCIGPKGCIYLHAEKE